MGTHVTPEKAISLTKISVALAYSWPPSLKSSKSQLVLFNLMWNVAFVSAVLLLLPLLNAIHLYRKDPIILGKSVSLSSAVAQVTMKMIVCRIQQKQFQALYSEMEDFCRHATPDEKVVLQRYVDKYKYFHGFYTMWCCLTTVFVICGPLYTQQSFPTYATYPFSVESQPLKSFVFLHQSLVGFQVSAGMAIDAQVALLLRYAAARFEILIRRMEHVETDDELNAWIEEHHELLRYTGALHQSIKLLILATIGTTTMAVIFGSLNLIAKQPILLKALYAIVVFSASVELFMYAWPADNLMRMSAKTSMAAYSTDWFKRNARFQRKTFFIILRSQKLETVRIIGILPKLSLSYYAKYLYKSFSYFTALRVMVETSNND